MHITDRYEINIYGVLVVLFLAFAIGYTVLIVRQQQIISQMASAKEKGAFGPTIVSDVVTITGHIEPKCDEKVFSLDSRQANTTDLRTLEASVTPNQGKVVVEINRTTTNVDADTEFILRGHGYIAKKKTLGDNNELDFGVLLPGDVNSDGKINQKDVDALNLKLKSKQFDANFDLNCDQLVNTGDRDLINASLGKVSD